MSGDLHDFSSDRFNARCPGAVPHPDGRLAGNALLALLPTADLDAMLPHFTAVRLARGVVLGDGVYFVLDGLISTFVVTSDGDKLHTGFTGREGAAGLAGLGNSSPSIQSVALNSATAAKISRSHFLGASSNSAGLRDLRAHYCDMMFCQAQHGIACNALHDAKSRLSTWLLRAHDRLPGQTLPLTQDQLAAMLGVRRTTVTVLAHEMSNEGLVRYSRGRIEVMCRTGLESRACDCYGVTPIALFSSIARL